MSEEKNAKKKSKVGIIILIIVIILLVAGGAVAATLYLVNKDDSANDNSSSAAVDSKSGREIVLVNEENVEEVIKEMEQKEDVPAGYYTVTMNPEWRFPDGKSASENAYVENSTMNTNSVYFDIIRNDTQETIYASPILTVGSNINQFKLDTELEKGTYDCTCTYQILDENNEPTSHLNVAVTIIVKN